MNKAQSQAQARTVPVKPPKAVAKAASPSTPRVKGGLRSGDVHHGKVEVASPAKPAAAAAPAAKQATAANKKAAKKPAAKAKKAGQAAAAGAGAGAAAKAPRARAAQAPVRKPSKPAAKAASTSQATSAASRPDVAMKAKNDPMPHAEPSSTPAVSSFAPVAVKRMEPVATKQGQKLTPVDADDDLAGDPLAAMAKVSRDAATAAAQAAANEDKLALALATRPVHEAVAILAEAGVGTAAAAQGDGQSRTFRDDPSLDRRIIEGMLDDKDSFLDTMHRQGFGRDAVVRRAAELGLSEALIRQVKGVAADLAGERPGRRPTPSSLGARTCLSCDRVFFSSGPGNRLCTRCRGGDAGLAQL